MGLDITTIRYHLYLKKKGFDFQRVAMLGRQKFYGINPGKLSSICRRFGYEMTIDQASNILHDQDGYVEPFYSWLGATIIHSFDASPYEGATHIWDMNQVLPEDYRQNYDFVFDGGTLEHIFNYSSALREVMTLPDIGGVFLSATPADSFLGHGFYQFSPDIAFETISESNGYDLFGVYLIEDRINTKFYKVSPPGEKRGRTLASSAWPTLMCFSGQRTGKVPLKLIAQQPDYSEAWVSGAHEERSRAGWKEVVNSAFTWMPDRLRNSGARQCRLFVSWICGNSFWDRPTLTRVDDI